MRSNSRRPALGSTSVSRTSDEVSSRHERRERTAQGRVAADPPTLRRVGEDSSAAEAISAVTLFELEIGVQRIERRDPTQGVRLRRWLEGVQMTFDGSILPLDADVAVRAARFHVPDPASDRDAIIAATAQVHGLAVVTRNIADFETFGVSLVNPWEG